MNLVSAIRVSRSPLAAFATMGLYWGAFAAQVPVFKAQTGANDAGFGLLMLCSSLGLVTAMWLAPRLEERAGRWALPLCALSLLVLFLGPGAVENPAAFGVAMMLVGVGSGMTDVVMNARVSALEARHGRSLMNLNHAAFSLAYAISAAATGIAREAGLGPVAVFSVCAVFSSMLVPVMRGCVPRSAEEPQTTGTGRLPATLVLLGGMIVLIAFATEAGIEGWSALHVERTLGGGGAEGAFGPAVLGLTMGIGRLTGQIVAHHLDETRVILWAVVLSASGAMIAALAPAVMVAYLGFGVLGLGVSVIAPMTLALVGRIATDRQRTVIIARTSVIGFVGFFIAPLMMGTISEAFGLRWSFVAVALLLGIVPTILFRLSRFDRRRV
ncbi:MAG: MFS transporter [Pseudomonadota bacterium]